jgi:ankyrin repeat protein
LSRLRDKTSSEAAAAEAEKIGLAGFVLDLRDGHVPEEGIAPHGHALYSTVAAGYFDIARILLEHGANPNAAVESSADCMSRAISRNDQPMIDLLASYGGTRSVEIMADYGDVRTAAAVFAANPAQANDPDALSNAAGEGHEPFVRLMLRYQPDLAARVGVAGKTRVLTELLFERGMNPSHRDWLHITPLHQFARRGDLENAALFIDHGADLHARDEDICSTPLGWAAKFGQRDMVELLLQRGARPNLPDDPPWATPVAWASRRGHAAIAEVLKRAAT